MASETEICNLALFRTGTGASLDDLETDKSTHANRCRIIYPLALAEVLRAFPWRFARRRRLLADAGAAPSTWGFAYLYPSDCLQFLALVLPGHRLPRWDQRPPFEVATDGEQTVIYADLSAAEGVYTTLVEDPKRFDPLFTSALAWKIAAELSRPGQAKSDAGNAAEQAYMRALSFAQARSLEEAQEGPEPECEFLAVRR